MTPHSKRHVHRSPSSFNLGYDSIYTTKNYHIVQGRGLNEPAMQIQPNNCDIKPYKNQLKVHKTMHFTQYCDRPPINKSDLKFQRPNDERFKEQNLLPDNLSSIMYKQNLQFNKATPRDLD